MSLLLAMTAQADPQTSYPAEWWTPVSDANPPAWEVLPQAGHPGKDVILSKRNELGVLSNFTKTPFRFHGKSYQSIEGFWQMMFYPENASDPRAKSSAVSWPHSRDEVSQMVAFAAKEAGDVGLANQKKLQIDWVSFEGRHFVYWTAEKGDQYQLIRQAMKAKLEQNPEVKRVLLATGNLNLLPDHHQPEDAPPSWKYFQIWMELRSELQAGPAKTQSGLPQK